MRDPTLAPAAPSGVASAPTAWPWWRRILFRFTFVYFGLYCLGSSWLDAFPFGFQIQQILNGPWERAVLWTGLHLFHLRGEAAARHITGSGDTALDWVQCAVWLTVAALATAIWSGLQRRSTGHPALRAWLFLLVRITLAFALIAYGLIKIAPSQFGTLTYRQVTEPFGNASPMGLLWTFMAASRPYTMVCGAVELCAGLLLLFERTRMLGALLALGAMGNVLALNLCYDVPVKLYSFHLGLMALLLASPGLPGLAHYFVRGRAAAPATLRLPPSGPRWLRLTGRALLAALIALTLYADVSGAIRSAHRPWTTPDGVPLAGAWDVTSFDLGGVELAATDPRRWRQLVIDYPNWWVVRYQSAPDGGFTVQSVQDTRATLNDAIQGTRAELAWERPDPRTLTLTGTLGGTPAKIRLLRADTDHLLLKTRGFHWISETPYNR